MVCNKCIAVASGLLRREAFAEAERAKIGEVVLRVASCIIASIIDKTARNDFATPTGNGIFRYYDVSVLKLIVVNTFHFTFLLT